MESVKERLIAFIAHKHISKAEFSRMIGVSQAYVTSIRGSMSPDKIQRIAMVFPELNIEWLMTGKGEMLQSVSRNGVVINGDNRMNNSTIDNRHYYSDSPDVLRAQIDVLEERIKEKDAQIKEKDAQIKEKDAQIKQLLDILQGKN